MFGIKSLKTKQQQQQLTRTKAAPSFDLASFLFPGRKQEYCAACAALSKPSPVKAVQRLPQEIHECIAQHLRRSNCCATCHLRDVAACARTCRNWRNGMASSLYTTISISGHDPPALKKRKMKIRYGSRLALLFRTLCVRPDYAGHVRELMITGYEAEGMSSKDLRRIHNGIAGIISQCPNLERLVGVFVPYSVGNNPIHEALSTRQNLKEHCWIFDVPGPMQLVSSELFATFHSNWTSLHTLVLEGSGGLNPMVFVDLFRYLPALKKLSLIRFRDYEFDGNALLALPILESLRLEELPGIAESSLIAFAARPASSKILTTLALIELEVLSLHTISSILTSLKCLKRLTLRQTSPPQLQPLSSKLALASSSLEYLHWDALIPSVTDKVLAKAIFSGLLPKLKKLRAPSDHHGVLQAVCKPMDRIMLDSDWGRTKRGVDNYKGYSRSLVEARIAAEERILGARERCFIRVVLTPPKEEDPDEGKYWRKRKQRRRRRQTKETFVEFGCFLGDLKSAVVYDLHPDIEESSEAVARVGDLTRWVKGGWGDNRQGDSDGDRDGEQLGVWDEEGFGDNGETERCTHPRQPDWSVMRLEILF